MAENSGQIFELLRNVAPQQNEFITRATGIKIEGRPVQLAVDSLSRPALLVPLSGRDPDIVDAESRGIRLGTFVVRQEVGEFRQLIVRCEELSLRPQFGHLIDDMLSRLSEIGLESAGDACLSVLGRWRHLLGAVKGDLLSIDAQIGLLAELHLLEALLHAGDESALEMWHGPDRSRHDFVSVVGSVEVKATLARESFPISIHGSKQLDRPANGTLSIYAEQYEEAPSGDSLADAVARIMSIGVESLAFLDMLSEVGFQLGDSPAYSAYRFSTVRSRLCLVDEAFPRISSSTLLEPTMLDQITRLQYSVNLAVLPPAVPDADALPYAVRILTNDVP